MDLQALFKEIHPNGTYQGWYKSFGDEQSKVANDTAYTPDGNEETLYGKFGYVITFISDGKVHQTLFTTTGSKGNQLANLGKTPTLGTYTFREWYTGQNGTGTKITTSYQFSGNTTVYAKWVSVISLRYNGAGGSDTNIDVVKGQQYTFPNPSSAYTFKNWWTVNNFTGTQYTGGQKITPNGNITIYAKWVSLVIFNLAQSNGMGSNPGFRPQAPIEVLKGQAVQGIDPFPEGNDFWSYWYDSYVNLGGHLMGGGNKLMSWNGSFVPTGGTINLYPGQ